jgi:hypothetical protein
MRKRLVKEFILLFLLFISNIALAQDNLYLIGTITGEPNARITDVKGIGDVNGDGYDDFMIATADNAVKLYLGSSNINLTPSVIFHYPGNDRLIGPLGGGNGIGDVNGDGYNDFAIKGVFADWGSEKGKVFLYFGGTNIETIPKYEFYEPWGQDWFGQNINSIGDINKDGYDDFMISSTYNWSNGKGRAYLFFGGDTISFSRSIIFVDTQAIGKSMDSYFGASVANIGDINKDGFEDIGISAGYDMSELSEKVYIYYGKTMMDTIPDAVFPYGKSEYGFGNVIKKAGDLNKDGLIDFCITGALNLYVYTSRDSLTKVNTFVYGSGIETDCDINHDGYGDFIIGNINYRNCDSVMVGAAFIYLGSEKIDTVYKYKFEGENKWDEFSRIITTSDINGDGYDELFILAPNYPDYNNPIGKIYIYSYNRLSQVEIDKEINPDKFVLYQNYPNPFNLTTVISYKLTVNSKINVKIYDILGREVATPANGIQQSGEHTVNFNASGLSSGVYFYCLKAGNFVTQKSMLLLK